MSIFNFMELGGYYFNQDAVTVTTKGLELELEKIMIIFTSIDFSSNNLCGELPSSIGNLISLYLLNVSHNALSGTIPASVGNLRELGSLDLSVNRLTGNIPVELASTTFPLILEPVLEQTVWHDPRRCSVSNVFSSFLRRKCHGFSLEASCNNKVGGFSPPMPQNEQPSLMEKIECGYISVDLGYAVGLGCTAWIFLFCSHGERYTLNM